MLGKKNIIDLDILDGPQLELEVARARQGPICMMTSIVVTWGEEAGERPEDRGPPPNSLTTAALRTAGAKHAITARRQL